MNAPHEKVISVEPNHLTPHPSYEHKAGFRHKLVYASDGVIYVNPVHAKDVDVVAEISNMRRAAGEILPLVREGVTLSTLEKIYEAAGKGSLSRQIARASTSSDQQQVIIELFNIGRHAGASDLHFTEIRGVKTIIEFRVFGELQVHTEISSSEGQLIIGSLCRSMLANVNSSTFDENTRFQGRLKDEFCKAAGLWSARLAATPTESGLHVVVRLQYKRRERHENLLDLGFLPAQAAVFDEYLRRGRGISLFTGPTNSGKSTSLKTLIDLYIKRTGRHRRALTIEHPVEFPIDGAVQMPLFEHSGLDDVRLATEFAQATTHALRLDPDLLMLGEVRARSGAAAAFTAAMTGHGLLTTLHVDDWLTTFERLLDLDVAPSLVFNPNLLRVISNQGLARTLCPHCRIPYRSEEARLAAPLRARVEAHCLPDKVYLRGHGCDHCTRGIAGQTIVAEVVKTDRRLMAAYRSSGGPFEAFDYWLQTGGRSKCSVLIEKINQGLIDPSTAEEDICLLDDDAAMQMSD